MAIPLVVGGVVRYCLNHTFSGRQVCNILDIHIDGGPTGSRNENVIDQAEIVARQWKQSILPNLCDDLILQSVSYVDLNAADGITGTFSGDDDPVLPAAGLLTESGMSANVSALITKSTSSGRGTKSGRLYLCGLAESATDQSDSNHLKPAAITQVQAAFDEFKDDVEQDGSVGGPAYESEIGVVHVPKVGDPSFTAMSAFSVQGLLATQRRRLRG